MWKIAIRSTRARFLSFGASVLAVFLGVAFVASTLSLREMLATTYEEVVDSGMTAAAYIQPDAEGNNVVTGVADPVIPLSIVPQLEALPDVAAVVPDVVGPVVLVNKDGTAAGTANGPPALAYGAYPSPGDLYVQGRPPAADDEVVLIDTTAQKSGYEVGDTATVLVNGEIMKFEVVGITEFGAAGGASVLLITPSLAEQVFAPHGLVSSIGVYADSQVTDQGVVTLSESVEDSFVAGLEQAGLAQILADLDTSGLVPDGAPSESAVSESAVSESAASETTAPQVVVASGSSAREVAKEQVNEQVGFIATFVLAFAAIAVGVSAFVIANTFAMITRRQQREYAMLRAIGASSTQVFTIVGVQALIVGLIGSALGLAASVLLLQALPAIFESFGMDMSSSASLAPSTVVTGFVVGVGVALFSACFSARRAALTAPVEAMREVAAPALETGRARSVIGGIITIVGAGATASAVLIARSQETVTTSGLYGLGIAAVFIGVLVLAAPLSSPFTALLTRPLRKVGRPIIPLAAGNVQRTPKRTAATASALIVGVTLTSAAAVVAASVNGSIGDVVKQEMQADFIVQSQTYHIAPSAYEDFKKVPGVDHFSSFAAGEVTIPQLQVDDAAPAAGNRAQILEIGATEPDTMGIAWTTTVIAGSLDAIQHGKAIVQEATATDNGWSLGDTLTLRTIQGEADVEIGGIINSVGLGMPVIIDISMLTTLVPEAEIQMANVMFNLAPDADPQDVRAELTRIASPYLVLSIFDQDEFTSELTGQINQMLAVIYALLGLTVVIAILGIVNTLGLGILERTREIGLLRAIGLNTRQLHSTITVESILIALFGTVVGLLLGVVLTLGIPTLFRDFGFTELVIPWQSLTVIALASIVVGVLAALWPAIRAARIPILTAIGSDE